MKKQFTLSKFLLPIFLLSISCSLSAQDAPMAGNAPITNAPAVVACPNSTIFVPITITGPNSISAITLRIEFDSTVMTFNQSLTSINSLLTGYFINSDTIGGGGVMQKIMFVWTVEQYPISIGPCTLMTLAFHYINGTSSLHFNNISNNGGDCQYAGGDYWPLTDTLTSNFYQDGQVSSGVVGGTVSGSSNITFGDSTGTFTVSGYVGNVVKWQKQFNGGGYVDITPFNTGTHYKAKPDTTGAWNYRAVVQYGSCPQAFSAPATDTVTAVNHAKTWTGAASTNWKKSVNWTPYGIPMLSENVTIPSGLSHYPLVSDQGLGCNNLTVEALATMNINSGIHLTINGTLNILGP